MKWTEKVKDFVSVLVGPKIEAPEERASDPIVVPVHLRRSLLHGTTDLQRLTAQQQKAAYVSILAMLVSFKASILAAGMLKSKVKRTRGDRTTEVEEKNPWVQLLRRPNKTMPSVLTYEWMFQNLEMVGCADFMVQTKSDFSRSVPVALHPIYPEFGFVEPNYDAVGQVESWDFYMEGRGPTRLEASNVLRIRQPNPVAPWLHHSLVKSAAYEIDTLSAQNIFSRDMARDQGKPQVMLEAERPLNPQTLLKRAREFASLYRTGGSGSVPVSHDGLKIKPMTLTPESLQMIKEKEFTREELFTLAGVPIQLFTGEAYATGANSHRRGFMENTIQPIMDKTVAQLQFELERLFRLRADSTLFIESPNMIPVDQRARVEIDEIRMRSGTPINRILEERGEEPVIGGDVSLVPATLIPLELVGGGEFV